MAATTADAERLRQLFAEPGLAWILERFERRLRAGRPLPSRLSRRNPSPEERRAFERLLGRPPSRTTSLHLPVATLEERLRHAGLAANLQQAVDLLLGRVVDRRARRRAELERLEQQLDRASRRDDRPAVHRWLRSRRTRVLLRRWARQGGGGERGGERILDHALEVLAKLPAERVPGERPLLQELAASVTGDAHALDLGRPLGTLVIAAVAGLVHLDANDRLWREDAAGWREIWARAGVLTDDLSAPALVFGLAGDHRSQLGRLLELHREAGEPARLSLRLLRRFEKPLRALLEDLRQSGAGAVYVCENPAVLQAAAERLGSRSAPLICVEGQPATAARLLMRALSAAGFELRYHGDFDWPGLRIANLVVERHGAVPWRYDAATYDRIAARRKEGPPLAGQPVEASWDDRLMPAMSARGFAVHEEAMLDELLDDLGDA